MSSPAPLDLPSTRRSKSFSPPPPAPFESYILQEGPAPIASFDMEIDEFPLLFDDSSLNFRVCSCSIFDDKVLIRLMNSWNCSRFSNGPRLKLHSIGRTSIAKKSASAILPTCLKTPSAAIITAGSLVLMAFNNGTTFSCTVYLSRIVLEFFFLIFAPLAAPSSPSPSSSLLAREPPQNMTNASNPRILMPKLLVLLNTAATTGKSSFLIVEKSNIASTVGRQLRDLSTIEWVGDSRPRCRIGRISARNQLSSHSNAEQNTVFELFPIAIFSDQLHAFQDHHETCFFRRVSLYRAGFSTRSHEYVP